MNINSVNTNLWPASLRAPNIGFNNNLLSNVNGLTPKSLSLLGTPASNSIDYSAINQVSNLKTEAAFLKNAVNGLQSAISKRGFVSADNDKMTLSANNNARFSSFAPNSVRIEQLAGGQKNTGAFFANNTKVDSSLVGMNQFSINRDDGTSKVISFDVNSNDTNKSMLNKMADAVNRAGVGVKASVVYDEKNERGAINLEATGTGTGKEGAFSITDVTGGAVSYTGASAVSKEAQDAVYYINGGNTARISNSNTVDIGGGITASFKQTSSTDVKINRGLDADSAVSALRQFADSYNRMVQLSNNSNMGVRLSNSLASLSGSHAGGLSDLGIEFKSSGEMTINQDKVRTAAEDGRLESQFSRNNSNSGFMNRLSRLADDVRLDTGKYIDRSSMFSSLMNSIKQSNYSALFNINNNSENSFLGLFVNTRV